MTKVGRIVVVLAAVAAGLVLPSVASAHAYLIRTSPAASRVLDGPPPNVQLTFDEAVEPRFAIVSVTDADGRQETTGTPRRSPSNPDTLIVPVRPHQAEGWFLVYWRAISVDGHPVQGAFTYAVGPNPGPAPQFPVPKVSATAATPQLLIARWVMFVSVMSAIGLLVLRLLVARPLIRRVRSSSLRPVSVALAVSSVIGLIAIPVYLDFSTANDSLRSVFDVGALVPLFRVTAFGRAIVDFELCFALFCVAGVDRRVGRSARTPTPVDRRAGRDHRRAARRRGGTDHSRARGARRADVAARADADVRLGSPGLGLGVDGRAAGAAGDLAHRAQATAGAGALSGRAAVLQRRAGVGDPAGRDRGRRGDHPHASRQRAVGDRLRASAAGQGGAADRRARPRRGEPAANQAAARRPPATAPITASRPPAC